MDPVQTETALQMLKKALHYLQRERRIAADAWTADIQRIELEMETTAPEDIPQDKRTLNLFIVLEDVTDARDTVENAFDSLANNIDKLPVHVRLRWPYVADWKQAQA